MTMSIDDELAELRAENALLRARLGTAKPRSGRGWGWAVPSAALIVIGAILAPVAIVTAWAGREVSSTDAFVDTFAPLASDRSVQTFIETQTVAVVNQHVDVRQVTSTVFDGIGDLDLPPRARSALSALEGPAADGVENLIGTTVHRFVASEQFADLFRTLLRTGHTQMVASLSGDRRAAVAIADDGAIGIQLGPIVAEVKERLVARGLTLAERIPAVDRTVVIATSDAAVQAQTAYTLTLATAAWLPWVVVAMIAIGVVMARRRARALALGSVAIAIAMLVTLAGLAVGRVLTVRALAPEVMPRNAARAIYDHVVAFVLSASIAVTVLALAVALVAWFAGTSASAVRLRHACTSGADTLRTWADGHGIGTGVVGEQIHRARVLIRTLIAVGAAAIIVFHRPLQPAVIVWTLVGALLVVAVVEVIGRPPRARSVSPASDDLAVPTVQ